MLPLGAHGQSGRLLHLLRINSAMPQQLKLDGQPTGHVAESSSTREHVVGILRAHEPELRAAGILRLYLFGSIARGAERSDSDVDLLAAFDETRQLSILDVIGIENRLFDLLGRRVDLVEEGTLKPRVRRNAEREAIRAF